MEAYKNWVRRNKDYVHSLESLANVVGLIRLLGFSGSLKFSVSVLYIMIYEVGIEVLCQYELLLDGMTWLLPERFSDSEIGPEAVTAFLGIITAINEHIIDTTPSQARRGSVGPSSFPYSLFISALKDLETLVEVVAQQYYGDDKKWNFVALMEAVKVVVRIALFRNCGYKMLLHGGDTPNIESSVNTTNSLYTNGRHMKSKESNGYPYMGGFNGPNPWRMEGRAMSALKSFGANARMGSNPAWYYRIQQQHAIMEPPAPVVKKHTFSSILSENGLPGALFLTGEVLFIIRPLIYVLFIRKYGIRSWIPWFISLAVDLIGVGGFSQVAMTWKTRKGQNAVLSSSEKDEMKRRKLLWALYLMRDPFFSKYTRQRLEKAEKALEPLPLIGLVTEKIVELIIGAQTRYTYMSGS
ncbi:Peroxisome membrane protein, Pex16 [Dillenia turbinata]|uniref:Peroxisomal membrane protein PEX16 n=1 Tax=Dillenia turbinata TaxID=194707 RepID=A0AAN8UR61_9MAGN